MMMGRARAAICRELTKLHEEIRAAPSPSWRSCRRRWKPAANSSLVIAPPAAERRIMSARAISTSCCGALERDSVKDAVAQAVELSGRPRREVYARALELAKESRGEHGEE